MIKKFAVALLMLTASGANAVTVTSSPGAPDPGASPDQMIIDSFSTGTTGPAGIVYGGSFTVDALTISGVRAAPAGGSSAYFATPGTGQGLPGVATIDFSGYIAANRELRSLSFYWGSIDTFNKLEVLNSSGAVIRTLVGNDLSNPANGNQTIAETNRRLFLRFTDTDDFASLRLTSTQRAFEIDDVAGSFVPEPTTWGMLVSGFALVGFASRRRRRTAIVAA